MFSTPHPVPAAPPCYSINTVTKIQMEVRQHRVVSIVIVLGRVELVASIHGYNYIDKLCAKLTVKHESSTTFN